MDPGQITFLADLVALRRDLHAHPELAFAETRTSDLVADELTRYGMQVHRGLARTGVIGVLRQGSSERAIGLRADMDALPLTEENTFAHRSCKPGLMHACGHDGHTAMLLGAARLLAEQRNEATFDGSVYFIFQPAEESEGGAQTMVAEGLFHKFPMDAVFGLHNWPGIPVGEMAVVAGPVMAGTCAFEIEVQGSGCHAAMPHQGVDTLLVVSHLVIALQTIVARNIHPCEAAVISVTQVHGGEAWNIIPETAILRGTIRSFDAAMQERVERLVERQCDGIGRAFGARLSVRFDHRYPPTVNSARESEICRQVASTLLGRDKVRANELPSMGAEDFSYMLREKPGCYVWLGNGPGSGGCTLHNPRYDFNDDILAIGIAYWIRLVETLLPRAT
ncbi:M20 aminoacylase family protein [Accumulibacter sp.]|uniref:M20 aminoacylase family protein n=1 Tax=Accumulibacter sp. TaxID=2053492 RepID=UPI002C3BC3FD|nr:M20 aminoacylase family protein [Accumulibacter sp.]HMW64312.1 M20 aminoacylase family protein [Accumulibacter sp.]HNE39132.1 M20 aminoacylase family protein [Accumulibacter sp.]HNG86505.1 M20 aminoacylase family protein [Accumulibacter sp.]HNJ50206.1 M20 aminoacylase family protein [Accumulibacter sp.]HNM65458.1 M20 aminoacylase family protein [Accumulibacter sp.]